MNVVAFILFILIVIAYICIIFQFAGVLGIISISAQIKRMNSIARKAAIMSLVAISLAFGFIVDRLEYWLPDSRFHRILALYPVDRYSAGERFVLMVVDFIDDSLIMLIDDIRCFKNNVKY